VSAISSANSGESRPDASARAFEAERSRRPAKSTGTSDTAGSETSVVVRQPGSAPHFTPQNDQLMSERRIWRNLPFVIRSITLLIESFTSQVETLRVNQAMLKAEIPYST
jgi:hypothetical protein